MRTHNITTKLVFTVIASLFFLSPVTAADTSLAELRAAQQQELVNLRNNSGGDIDPAASKTIKEKYKNMDRRGEEINKTLEQFAERNPDGRIVRDSQGRIKGAIENTGSNPKDVRADVDLNAKTMDAADTLTKQWETTYGKNNIVDSGYKVVNKATDTTLWKPCTTSECIAAKINDTDAWTTEGGLKGTGNEGRIYDPRGYYADNEKKFIHGKEEFGHAAANLDAIDELRVFEGFKTAAKSLDKAAGWARTRTKDDFWQKLDRIRNEYYDPWEAGIANSKDPVAKQIQDINEFLGRAEQEMLTAKGILVRRGQAVDQAREEVQKSLQEANPVDPDAAAMNKEGADAIKSKREKVASSNEPVEEFNREQGGIGREPGTSPPPRQLPKSPPPKENPPIEEPTGGSAGSEPPVEPPVEAGAGNKPPAPEPVSPAAGREPPGPGPAAAGGAPPTERVPTAEQPAAGSGRAGPAAEIATAPTVAGRIRGAATGAATGAAMGAAFTAVTCLLTPSNAEDWGEFFRQCVAQTFGSIPFGAALGAIMATGPAGAALVEIYIDYEAAKAVKELGEEVGKLPETMQAARNEAEANNQLTSQLLGKRREIDDAVAACQYDQALALARKVQSEFGGWGLRPDGGRVKLPFPDAIPYATWLPTTLAILKKNAGAQQGVDNLLSRAAATSDQRFKSQLLSAALNMASGAPCLVKKVQEAQKSLPQAVSEEPYCIYVVDASGGAIWIGTESQQKRTPASAIKGAGVGRQPPRVIKQMTCHPTKELANAAWCKELQGKTIEAPTLANNSRADVYGGKYWIDSAPPCPAVVVRKLIQEAQPAQPPAAPPAIAKPAETSKATCAIGKAQIETARRQGNKKELARLETVVPGICDREAHERETARTGGAQKPSVQTDAPQSIQPSPAPPAPDPKIGVSDATSAECVAARAKLAEAAMLTGIDRFEDAEKALSTINVHKCPSIASEISREQSKIASAIDRISNAAVEARRTCNVAQLAELNGRLMGSKRLRDLASGLGAMTATIKRSETGLAAARNANNNGNIQEAMRELEKARGDIETLPKQGQCQRIRDDIAAEQAKAGKATASNDKVKEVIASCDVAKMTAYRSELAKEARIYQTALGQLESSIKQVESVRTRIGEARAALGLGKLDAADSSLAQARKTLQDLPNRCASLTESADKIATEIGRIRETIQGAESAINSCDKAKLDASRAALARLDNPAAKPVLTRLNSEAVECARRERAQAVDAANETCRRNFGDFSIPVPETIGGNVKCNCVKGYQKTRDQDSCERIKTREEIMAEGHQSCRSGNGEHSIATRQNKDGSFDCGCESGFEWNGDSKACERRKTQQEKVAEAHESCQKEFGEYALATALKRDGNFNCICQQGFYWNSSNTTCERQKTQQEKVAEAHESCQKEFGEYALATALKRDGNFNCICRQGFDWNSSNTACERQKTQQEVMAEGTESCRSTYGNYSIAGKRNRDGTFNCACVSGFEFNAAGDECVQIRSRASASRAPQAPSGRCPPGDEWEWDDEEQECINWKEEAEDMVKALSPLLRSPHPSTRAR